MRVVAAVRLCSAGLLAVALSCSGSGDPSGPPEPPPPVTTGTLRAIVLNPGQGTDADGYLLTLAGTGTEAVGTADTVIYNNLPAGPYTLTLSGLSVNCRSTASLARTPTVVAGQTVTVSFSVDCVIPFSNQILYVRLATGTVQFYTLSAGGAGIPVGTATSDYIDFPRASPDGMHLAYVRGNSTTRISVMDPDGKNSRDLSTTCGTEPAWRPDGQAVAYSCAEANASDIYIVNADGTGAHNITNSPGAHEEHPSWSPDGTKIVFEGNDAGGGLFIINADGSNRTQLTTVSTDEYAEWSPVGQTIAFARWNGGTRQILTITADGNTVTEVSPSFANIDQTPTWSQDGSQIAFVRYLGSSYDLYQVAAGGGTPTRRTNGLIVQNPGWKRP